MPTVHSGIDEAGYGPILGPLSIAAVSVVVDDGADLRGAFRWKRTGVKDSKEVHTTGDIEPIESVALAAIQWLTGSIPSNAAECFSLVGETQAHRADKPWMAAASDLRIPAAAARIKKWTLAGLSPLAIDGALVQPCRFNHTIRSGVNKADLELAHIKTMLARMPQPYSESATVIDRLGGRRYYGAALQEVWPSATVAIETEENPELSSYLITSSERRHRISFCVEGEKHSPLTAMASCIAKYLRELHMLLFNGYWCERQPGLKPTAGYGPDARRWVRQLLSTELEQHGGRMVRGHGMNAALRAAALGEDALRGTAG
jgi:ribonuclease HII